MHSRASGIAELLDSSRPGWHQEIDVSKLDMDCGNRCLLGQLYGGYTRGLIALGIRHEDAPGLGVVVPDVYAHDPNTDDEMLEGIFGAELERLHADVLKEINDRRSFDAEVESMTAEAREMEREAVYA